MGVEQAEASRPAQVRNPELRGRPVGVTQKYLVVSSPLLVLQVTALPPRPTTPRTACTQPATCGPSPCLSPGHLQLRRAAAGRDQADGGARGAAALPCAGAGQVGGRWERDWLRRCSAVHLCVRLLKHCRGWAPPAARLCPPLMPCRACCAPLQRRGPEPLPRRQQADPGRAAAVWHRREAGAG